MLKNYLIVFFVSMVPVVELRGAIPIGLGLGLPVLPTYIICVLGNMLPVTLGNLLGGLLVGFGAWYCFLRRGRQA